ncbi:MAG: hypothetical protein NWE89_08330 [Candidatus Bathyarchaeota archaeon]|nr:hypothetical protein [Candidatus Bathyarchaeota archaeon]
MSKIKFEMKKVEKKREKKSTKRSIFDPMIDQFIEGGEELVEISVEDKRASYIVSQLKKRIGVRELEIDVSNAQGFVYLEKKTREPV